MFARRTIVLSAFFLLLACWATSRVYAQPSRPDSPQDPPKDNVAEESSSPLENIPSATETDLQLLKKARVDAARLRAMTLQSKLDKGVRVNPLEMRQACVELKQAELDVSKTPRERVVAFKRWYDAAWDFEQKKVAGYEAGRPDSSREVIASAIAARSQAQAAYIRACAEAEIIPFADEKVSDPAPIRPREADRDERGWSIEDAPSARETDAAVLRNGRIAAARDCEACLSAKLNAGGSVNFLELRDARQQLVEAELAVITTVGERIDALRRLHAAAVEYEEQKTVGFSAGRQDSSREILSGAISTRLKAQAAYVQACRDADREPFADTKRSEPFPGRQEEFIPFHLREDPKMEEEVAFPDGPLGSLPSPTSADLHMLRNAHVKAARDRVETLLAKLYAGVHVNHLDILEACDDFLEAELALIESPRDQLTPLADRHASALDYERMKLAGFQARRQDSPTEALAAAVAARLKVQAAYVEACQAVEVEPFGYEQILSQTRSQIGAIRNDIAELRYKLRAGSFPPRRELEMQDHPDPRGHLNEPDAFEENEPILRPNPSNEGGLEQPLPASSPEPPSTAETDVSVLKEARVTLARDRVLSLLDTIGGVMLGDVRDALDQLVEAELELAATPQERAACYRRVYDFARNYEMQKENETGLKARRDELSGVRALRVEFQAAYVEACQQAKVRPFDDAAKPRLRPKAEERSLPFPPPRDPPRPMGDEPEPDPQPDARAAAPHGARSHSQPENDPDLPIPLPPEQGGDEP